MKITSRKLRVGRYIRFVDGFLSGKWDGKWFEVTDEDGPAFFKRDGRKAFSFWAREIYPIKRGRNKAFYMWAYIDDHRIAEIKKRLPEMA